jgi:hypothetical protein
MSLSLISKEELYKFIERNFRSHGLAIEPQTIHSILDKSTGQPHFTQYFASVVFDLIRSGTKQSDKGFQDVWLKKILNSQSDIFQDIFDQLTNSQRASMQAVAASSENGIYSQEIKDKYDLPVSSSLTEALKALQRKGLIYKTESTYEITNPLFKEWLLRLK